MKYLPVFLFVLLSHVTIAQDLIESRQTSYYTYIYKLSDQEARKIYNKDLWQVDPSYFHTLVDSFPTDSTFTKSLAIGHYLKVHSEKNKLKFDITSVQNFDVIVARNNTDLVLHVLDIVGDFALLGTIIAIILC